MDLLNRRREIIANLGSSANEIPYIRGGADGSYIDTGIKADNTVKVVVWARNVNPSTGNTIIFGSQISTGTGAFTLFTSMSAWTGNFVARFGNSGNLDASDAWKYMSHYHKYELGPDGFFVDDTQLATISQTTFSNNLNIHLFGLNHNGSHTGSYLPIDVSACKIYKGGVLVRDFTAVQGGFYDAVSETTFTNAGSGSFTYGTFNPNAYVPLEYISCTAQQYFDTGIYGTNNTEVVTKFRPTGTAKTFYRVFGTRAVGGTFMCELMIGNTSDANRYYDARYNNKWERVYSGVSQTNNDLVYVHNANKFTLFKNQTLLGTKTLAASAFTTTYTMYVASSNLIGSWAEYAFRGYIYFMGFRAERNFVPAKKNNMVGMYDTYNDKFYPSESGTAFIAGPEI